MRLKVKGMIDEDDPRVSQVGHPGPPWSIAYGDLMTELVCFFVILYALSAALNKDMQKAQQDIQEMINEGKMSGSVQMDKEGMRITMEEQSDMAFFESGSAELTERMRLQLDKISPVLYKLAEKHDIVVEGHTDDIPIATREYANNWELSTARATSVVMSMLGAKFPPKRMAAVGYGEYHPKVPNTSVANRKTNRRVVFFIKNTPYPDTPQPPGLVGAPAAPLPADGQAPAPPAEAPAVPETPAPAGEAPAEGG